MGDDGGKERALSPAAQSAPDPDQSRDRTGNRFGAPPPELAAVFQEHGQSMLRTAFRVTGSLADAEDVLQTVFLRLAGRSGGTGLEGPGAGAYLRRAALNAALDLVRGRKRRRSVALGDGEELEPVDAGADPERRQQGREARELLRRALAKVSPKAAEVFTLRYFEGLGNQEIARSLSMSQTAVAVTLHRTRSRLRHELATLPGGLS